MFVGFSFLMGLFLSICYLRLYKEMNNPQIFIRLNCLINLCVYIGINSTSSLSFFYLFMFLFGSSIAIFTCSTSEHIIDVIDPLHQQSISTFYKFLDKLMLFSGPLCFLYINPSWKYLVEVGVYMTLFNIILLPIVQQSPFYLFHSS